MAFKALSLPATILASMLLLALVDAISYKRPCIINIALQIYFLAYYIYTKTAKL